jgi:hypothetical protein
MFSILSFDDPPAGKLLKEFGWMRERVLQIWLALVSRRSLSRTRASAAVHPQAESARVQHVDRSFMSVRNHGPALPAPPPPIASQSDFV